MYMLSNNRHIHIHLPSSPIVTFAVYFTSIISIFQLSLFKICECCFANVYDLFLNQSIDCGYQGKIFKSGESFPKGDKCNTCICSITGEVRCTEMSCVDNYKTKKTQSYITKRRPTLSYDSKY